MSYLFAGDIGVSLIIYTNYDLTDAITVELRCKKPGGSVESLFPQIIDRPKGILLYSTTGYDFDIPGKYQLQVLVVFSDGKKLHGDIYVLDVLEVI